MDTTAEQVAPDVLRPKGMIKIAVLSEQVTAQIREAVTEKARELDSVQVVFSGTSSDDLRRRGQALRPQVLVLDIGLLNTAGNDLRQELEGLLTTTGAELALVLYSFTRREVVQQITSNRSRAIKAPMSLATLRLNMLSLLVKDALGKQGAESQSRGESSHAIPSFGSSSGGFPPVNPSRSESELSPLPPNHPRDQSFIPPASSGDAEPMPTARLPRVFTQGQLGRLQELKSAIRCECPSHLSELVSGLAAFEEYSRKCENAGDEDAKLHGYLYQQTSRARRLMEETLLTLCRYERLDI